jgi:hypothetical protein
MGIDLTLNYSNSKGATVSSTLSPSINVRWQIDTLTSLYINYTVEQNSVLDALTELTQNQTIRGTALQLVHTFSRSTSLELVYYFQRFSYGAEEWQREFNAYLTTHF